MISAAEFLKWLEVFNINSGSGTGTVSPGLINQLGVYAANGDVISGLATANNGLLSTNGSGVPAINNTVDFVGQFNVDNLRLDGNTISTTNTNGNLVLTPNGTGSITSTKAVAFSNSLATPFSITSALNETVSSVFETTSTGTSARFQLQLRNTIANGQLILTGANYTGVAGWTNRLILGADALISGGILLRTTSSGGIQLTADGSINTANLLVNSSGNTVLSGSLTTSQTAGIIGTTTNNNADAGSVGEVISSLVAIGSPVSITSATNTEITTIELTAGDWDVTAMTGFTPAATTNVVRLIGYISTGSVGIPAANFYNILTGASGGTVYGGEGVSFNPPMRRISLSTTTTIYLACRSSHSVSTLTGYGEIIARRVR